MNNIMCKKENDATEPIDDSALLNTILNQDGSVTRLLETLFQEPIEVELLNQHYQSADKNKVKGNRDNEKRLYRNVFLTGSETDTRYLYATSVIRTDYLNAEIVEALLNQKIGIGKIIEQYKIETYRELLEIKPVDSDIMRSMFKTKGDISSREYEIYIDSVASIRIAEYYPHELYLGLNGSM